MTKCVVSLFFAALHPDESRFTVLQFQGVAQVIVLLVVVQVVECDSKWAALRVVALRVIDGHTKAETHVTGAEDE